MVLRSGSVCVFDTLGEFVTKLVASDGAVVGRFGVYVSISASTIVVDAYWDNNKSTLFLHYCTLLFLFFIRELIKLCICY